MSLETVLSALTEAMQAQTEALNRNTDISEKLLASRSGAPTTRVKTALGIEGEEGIATDAEIEKPAKKTPAKKPATKKPAAKKTPAKKEPEPEPEEPEADDVVDDAEPKTMLDVRTAAVALRDEVGKDALETAKKAFKITAVKELSEDNFAMFVRYCEDKIAEEGV